MSANSKKKVCWNCETKVALAQENCSSCGVYLSPITEDDPQSSYTILIPPYQVQQEEESIVSKTPCESICKQTNEKWGPESIKFVLVTMCLLFLGSILVLFSSFMLIFSQNGSLTLQWDAGYWYVYLSAALPLLFLGWRGLHSISD